MLAAIELIEQIQKHLARDDADEIKLRAVVRAWEQRSNDGRNETKPKAVVLKAEGPTMTKRALSDKVALLVASGR